MRITPIFVCRVVVVLLPLICAQKAFAQMSLSASGIAAMPNSCDNIPKPSEKSATCGKPDSPTEPIYPQTISKCDCENVADSTGGVSVENSMSQGTMVVRDSGDVRPGMVPGGCSSCGGGGTIPAATQLPRLEFARIWRSTWTHDGSFGTGMYSNYDYYVTYASSLIEIRDPNTDYIERFIPSGSGSFIPAPGITYHSAASYSSSANQVTITQPGGTTLLFDVTGYSQDSINFRCRLNNIADRNNNQVAFSYVVNPPTAGTNQGVMQLSSGTDAYGRTAQFGYQTFGSLYVMNSATFSDSRSVQYNYTADNTKFVHQITYLPSGGTASNIGSTWYASSGGSASLNEALLPADQYNTHVDFASNCYGRVIDILHGDGNYAYARNVSASGGTSTILTWNQNVVKQFTRSPTQQMISSAKQLSDGSWETPVTFSASGAYAPPSSYLEPAVPGVPARVTSVVRDPNSGMVLQWNYPDGTSESKTYNGFNQVTSHTDRLGHLETFDFDPSGNLLCHTVAVNTRDQASEHWTVNSKGQVLTYCDFNCNMTGFQYYGSGGTGGAAGELQAIMLPGSASGPQPSGSITFTFNDFGLVTSVTDPANRTITFNFNAANQLISTAYPDLSTEVVTFSPSATFSAQVLSTSDRNGNATAYTHDSTGRVVLTQGFQGSAGTAGSILTSTSNTFTPSTGLLASVNTDGRQTDFTFDYLDRTIATTVHPSGTLALTSSSFFDRYRLNKTVDYYGRGTTMAYDNLDRVTAMAQELTPGGALITNKTIYNAQGLVDISIDGNGNRTKYHYDNRNRRVATTVALGTPAEATSSVILDANSNALVRKDERGKLWTSTFTVRNQVATSADPLGDTTRYAFTTDGLVASMTNANTHVTTNQYEMCCARLYKQTDNDNNSKYFYYDPNGNTIGTMDESGKTVNYGFDGLNRQVLMVTASGSLSLTSSTAYINPTGGTIGQYVVTTNPALQVITTMLDGLGRTGMISGNTAPVAYGYDTVIASGVDAGLLMTSVVTGSGTTILTTSAYTDGGGRTIKSFDGMGNYTLMAYDANGNLLTSTDQDNQTTTNTYDARDRLTTTQGNSGGISALTSYTFDPNGNLLTVTDPDGKVTSYLYDNANRRISTTYAFGTGDARTWSMTYKPLGQLATLSKPTGINITYGYEDRELLASRTYAKGSGTLGTDNFTYAPNRLLLSASGGLYNMNVTRGTASYDPANRLINETETFGATAKTMSYGYTPDSLISQTTYPGGTVAGRTYNANRLLYQTLINSSTQATFLYDPADRRTQMTYANSAQTTWSLDADSRITNISLVGTGGTLQQWGYAYTNAGDPLMQNDMSYGTMGEAYQTDGLHRLAAYQRGTVSSTGSTVPTPTASQNWALAAAGDWSQWTTTTGTTSLTDTRTHNNIHALTNRSAVANPLTYDCNFNQTDDGTAYKLVYDANDQLQQVLNRSMLALVGSYAYDAFGRRTQKFVTSGSVTTTYYSAGSQVVEEDGASGVNAFYAYGTYIDEPLTMDRGGNRYYYHANRLHSVYLLSNSAGGVAERYSYTPYGVATAYNASYTSTGSTSSVGNPYLFTGRELDSESLLYSYRARTNDPAQGRFKQLDPIGLSGGVNLYEYVGDSPAKVPDPFGLQHPFQGIPWPPDAYPPYIPPTPLCCCCCVDDLKLTKGEPIDTPTRMGNNFEVVADLSYVEAKKSGDDCKLEWFERSNVPYWEDVYPTIYWTDMHIVMGGKGLLAWDRRNKDCPTTVIHPVVLADNPSLTRYSGGTISRTETRILEFKVVVTSSPGCPCKGPASKTVTAEQVLVMVNGEPNWLSSSFTTPIR